MTQTLWEFTKRSLLDYRLVFLIYPALFLFIFSNDLNIIGLNSLVYRKQCLAAYNTTICNDIHAHPDASIRVQEQASLQQIWLNVAFIVPALFAIVHFSGMADKRLNYQVPLLVSVFGSMLNAGLLLVATDLDGDACFRLVFTAQAIGGVFGGGSLCFISSCFSHISVYEEGVDGGQEAGRTRSVRFSLCEASLLIGQFLGSLLSGYLIGNKTELAGFKKTFYVSTGIYLVVFIYVVCIFQYLKGLKKPPKESEPPPRAQKSLSVKSLFQNEISFFSDTFRILSRTRANNARFHIISLLVVYFVGASISMGLNSVQYLYLVKSASIRLSQVHYGYFKSLNTLARAVALLVVLPVLKYYELADYWFYLIGITSEFLNLIVFAVASEVKLLIWTAPVMYMFSNYFVVCIRLFASKLVEPNETGKYFGLIALVEFLVILVSSSVIAIVYKATVATFPTLVYIFCTGVCLLFCYPFLAFIIRDLKRIAATSHQPAVKTSELLSADNPTFEE